MQTCLLAALLLLGGTKCLADRRLLHGGHAHEEEAQAAATSQAGTPTEGHVVRAFELHSFGFGSLIKELAHKSRSGRHNYHASKSRERYLHSRRVCVGYSDAICVLPALMIYTCKDEYTWHP